MAIVVWILIALVLIGWTLLMWPQLTRDTSLRGMGFPTHEELAARGISGEQFYSAYMEEYRRSGKLWPPPKPDFICAPKKLPIPPRPR
jgi:hypothetical protein